IQQENLEELIESEFSRSVDLLNQFGNSNDQELEPFVEKLENDLSYAAAELRLMNECNQKKLENEYSVAVEKAADGYSKVMIERLAKKVFFTDSSYDILHEEVSNVAMDEFK